MASLTTMAVEQALPPKPQRQRSERSLEREKIREEYKEHLKAALENGEAMVAYLEEGDRPMNVKARIRTAANKLGIEGLQISKRGDRIVAYVPAAEPDEAPDVEAEKPARAPRSRRKHQEAEAEVPEALEGVSWAQTADPSEEPVQEPAAIS